MNRMFNRPVGLPLKIKVRPNNYDSFRINRRRISLVPEAEQTSPPVNNNVEDGEEENPRSQIVLQQGESTAEDRNTTSFSSAAGVFQDVVNNVLRKRDGARNTTIEMENRTNQSSGRREIISAITTNDQAIGLQFYLRFMFYTGVIPYKVNERKTHPVTSAINKILFVLVIIFGLIHALDNIKYYGLQFVNDRKLIGFISLGFNIKILVVRLLFAVILTIGRKKIAGLFKILLQKQMQGDFVDDSKEVYFTSIVLCCLTISVSLAFTGTQWGEWSVQTMVIYQAYHGRHIVEVWSPEQYANVSDKIWDESENQGLSVSNLGWAFLGFTSSFGGYLIDNCMKDLMLLASLALASMSKWFNDNLETEPCKPEDKIPALENNLRRRSRLKQIALGFNSTFGSVFTLLHIGNLFLFAYFLLTSHRHKDDGFMILLKLFVEVVKISYTYYKAAKASTANKEFLKWIRMNFRRRDYYNPHPEIDIAVTMDEIKNEPVGIGRGDFIITESFVVRLFTLVSSYFVFLVEEEPDAVLDEDDD